MPTTITLREETKELLRMLKGSKDWDSFLRELAENYLEMKREENRKKLRELLVLDFEDVRVNEWAREY